jgi:hypothetical protein
MTSPDDKDVSFSYVEDTQTTKKDQAMTLLLETPKNAETDIDELPPTEPRSPRWGRNILLGFGALGLVAAATASAVALPHLDDGTGDRTYHPTTIADVDHSYQFGIGTLTVDLRDVDFPPGIHTIEVNHGIGSANVWLPADVDYDVTGDLGAGDLDVLGESEDGFNNSVDARSTTDGTTTVIVDLEVDIGYGRVRQG